MMKKKTPAVAATQLDAAALSLNLKQASQATGLSLWAIRMLVWQGRLPARKIGKALVILRNDLDAALKNIPPVSPSDAAWLAKRTAVQS